MGIWDTLSQNLYGGYKPTGGSLLSGLGSAAEKVGTALGLPEWGISEALTGQPAPTYVQPSGAVKGTYDFGPRVIDTGTAEEFATRAKEAAYTGPQYTTPVSTVPTPQPTPQPTGGIDQGQLIAEMMKRGHSYSTAMGAIQGRGLENLWREYMGGGTTQTTQIPTGLSPEELAAQEEAKLRQREIEEEERKKGVISGIEAQYAPIFQELDRRLGLLPEQRADLEKTVGDIYSTLVGQVESYATAPRGAITLAGEKETTRAAKSLRELAEAGRGILGGISNIYGASSAVPAVTAAMTRELTRQRANILGKRDEVLAELDQKSVEVDSMVADEKAKIDLWKTSQLADIGEEIRKRTDEIKAQWAGASTEKAANLKALEVQVFQNAQQRLLNLDNQIREYKVSLDAYNQKTQTDLASYAQQLQLAAQYQQPSYSYDLSKLTPGQAQTISTSSGQKFPYTIGGTTYWLTPEEKKETEKYVSVYPGQSVYQVSGGTATPVSGLSNWQDILNK